MKAAYQTRYGAPDTVAVRDVPRPDPAADEILVQVHASTVTTADWRARASDFPSAAMWLPGRLVFGLFRPRHPTGGMEFSGRVVSKGANVTEFKGGDAVFGFAAHGAHAEYLAIKANGVVVPKPASISHNEAAAVPFGALSALVFLRDFARVQPGEKVLIHGASGGVGVFAVQLAKHFGAEVTAVASAANHDLLRDLGADHVIDYRTEDFTQGETRYDLVFDTVGKTRFRDVKRVLTPTGIFLPLEFGPREAAQALLTARSRGPRVVVGVSGDSKADLAIVAGLMESGEIRAVIDSTFSLDRIAEAHARVETRHKRGGVVVEVRPDSGAARAA